jgi:hypothetical protein
MVGGGKSGQPRGMLMDHRCAAFKSAIATGVNPNSILEQHQCCRNNEHHAVWFVTLRGVAWDHVVARLDRGDPWTHRLHHCPRFMPKDAREETFWVGAFPSVNVSVAERVGHNLHTDFACFRCVDGNIFAHKRLLWCVPSVFGRNLQCEVVRRVDTREECHWSHACSLQAEE